MSMTKAEKAAMEALRVRCALSWPPPPPKPIDIAVAREGLGRDYLHAWWFNLGRGMVGQGVTNGSVSATHNYGDAELADRFSRNARVSLSQGPGGPWFATELDALQALHHAIARDCAERLAAIAKRVEESARD